MSLASQDTGPLRAEHFPERAPLYPRHACAALLDLGHAALVDRFDGEDENALEKTGRVALADLTNLPRLGLRGKAAGAFIATLGYHAPEAPNQLSRQRDGVMLLRLSQSEYLFLGGFQDKGASIRALEQNAQAQNTQNSSGRYWLPRQDSHAWFWLGGPRLYEVMAKLCGVDLRPGAFATGAVAQTSVARLNAIVANTGSETHPAFQLLFDRSSAHYFWDALQDAMREFDGRATGFDAVARYGQTA